jgi:acyl carrier protein
MQSYTAMQTPDTDQLIRAAIAASCELPTESLPDDASILDLGLDSMRLLSILSQVGSACGVDIAGEDTVELFNAGSVGELICLIEGIVRRRDGNRELQAI